MSFSSPNPRPTGSKMPAEDEGEPFQQVNQSTAKADEEPSFRRGSSRSRRLGKPEAKENLTGTQRLLLLDTWRRSGLPAGDFAPLVGISKHTLYAWKHRFETEGEGHFWQTDFFSFVLKPLKFTTEPQRHGGTEQSTEAFRRCDSNAS